MSMPLDQQKRPPPSPSLTVTQLPDTSSSRHGSIGPLIAVLAVVAILSALAVIVGRFCSGRRIMGYGQYDIESWLELKCSSCIDGRINPPPMPSTDVSAGSAPPSIPAHIHAETKQEDDPSPKNPTPSGGS